MEATLDRIQIEIESSANAVDERLEKVGAAMKGLCKQVTPTCGGLTNLRKALDRISEKQRNSPFGRLQETLKSYTTSPIKSVGLEKIDRQIKQTESQLDSLQDKYDALSAFRGIGTPGTQAETAAQLADLERQLDEVSARYDNLDAARREAMGQRVDTGVDLKKLLELERLTTEASPPLLYGLDSVRLGVLGLGKAVGTVLHSGLDRFVTLLRDIGKGGLSQLKSGLSSIGRHISKQFTAPFSRALSAVQRWKTALGRVAFYRTVRGALKAVTEGLETGMENLYHFSELTGTAFAPSMDRLASSGLLLKNSLAAMAAPLIEALAPAVDFVVDKISGLYNMLGATFAALTGASSYTKAVRSGAKWMEDTEKSAGGAAQAAKELRRQLIGIDELTVLEAPDGVSGGSGGASLPDYGSMFETVPVEGMDWAAGIRDAITAGDWTGAGSLLANKLNSLVSSVRFEDIGANLGGVIQKGLDFALGFIRGVDWATPGGGLADALNGLFDSVNPADLGALLASKIRIAVDFAGGFVSKLKWPEVGEWLGGVVNGWFAEIDETELAHTVSEAIKGGFALVSGFFQRTDFEQIGQQIGRLIAELDWKGIFKGAFSAAGDIGKALVEALSGVLQEADLSSLASAGGALGLYKILSHPLKSLSKLGGTGEAVSSAAESVSTATSSMTPKLQALQKDLGLGITIIGEVAGAALLMVGAIELLGRELERVGDAWQPVIENGNTVATAMGIGTGLLAGIGGAAYLLGTAGKTIAVNVGIGTGILLEIGLAAGLFIVEVWAVGKGLDEVGKAWEPVLNNGETIAEGIAIGTGLLAGIGVVTAALGAVTIAGAGTLPLAIGIGTAVLVELGGATVLFIESLTAVADELTNRLAPALIDLNAELPTLTQNMGNFKDYMAEFAGFVVEYTKNESIAALNATGNAIVDFFTADPFKKMSNDVEQTYGYTQTLNENLNLAVPELQTAVDLLTDYKTLSDQIAEITASQNGADFVDDFFINMKNAGKNIVLGLADGISKNAKQAVSAIEDLSTNVQNAVNTMETEVNTDFTSISTAVSTSMETVKSKTTSTFNTVSSSVQSNLSRAASNYTTYWGTITRTAIDSSNKILQQIPGAWANAGSIISGALAGMQSTVSSAFSSIVSSAWSWGRDIAVNLANGMSQNYYYVANAANYLARWISAYLHFSEPDVGPLSDFHTYMPDMLKTMAQGIRENSYLAISAVSDLSGAMSEQFSSFEAPDFSAEPDYSVNVNRAMSFAYDGDSGVSDFSTQMQERDEEVISVIFAAAQQIVRAINEKDSNMYMDGRRMTSQITSTQDRQNRIYGKTLQNA